MNELERRTVRHILLTIDVEDWFQVENFKPCISFDSWPSRDLRVERNTHRLLDLLDSSPLTASNATTSTNPADPTTPWATFFILAWVAERLPGLVREIHARGHEVASHGCRHELCSSQPRESLLKDLIQSRHILEDITGQGVYGFRAPSFSVSEPILECIRDAGYLYDSSYNSFSLHGRYGRLSLHPKSNGARDGTLMQPVEGLVEIPISNVSLGSKIVPWGGGAYFRLIPERAFRSGIRRILNRQQAYIMYLHPWELDPEQPRVKEASAARRFRHYTNLHKTQIRLRNLIAAFSDCAFVTCKEYMHQARPTPPFPSPRSPQQTP